MGGARDWRCVGRAGAGAACCLPHAAATCSLAWPPPAHPPAESPACHPAGHSYLTYGPLLNRSTQVIFEGVPTYPDPGRCWDVIDK